MKPYKILIFILSAFLCLGLLGMMFPEEDVKIGAFSLYFPSPAAVLAVENKPVIDIEENLELLKQQAHIAEMNTVADSLSFFKHFVTTNTARFYFPNDDYTWLDNFFSVLRNAPASAQAVHLLHYGDSQIEMDRISSVFRQRLQEEFGGEGAGIVPAIQTIPSVSIRQSYTGSLARYVPYGDSTQPRASHRRYGLMINVGQLRGQANISVGASGYRQAQEGTKKFSRLTLIVGNNAANFSATCQSKTRSVGEAKQGVSTLVWDFDPPVSRAVLNLNGIAEIYGVSMEGTSGVTVDNVPLRGSSGTLFTRIDAQVLEQCYKQMNVKMIIMQFGGNSVPYLKGQKAIDNYAASIAKQIQYLQKINPHARILFIGPSDMAKRLNGKMQTYPDLPLINETLKQTVLQNNAAYWDMFQVMGGENSMELWVKHSPQWAGADYIHFTEAGANQIANTLSDAFMVHYQFYERRRTIKPELIKQFMEQ
ncbi:MAG: GDSL-type esterase/lipase family protein [Bacteroidales bacterium]|jgi:lysophospholipase L1-like esterase|nr:GDSL-type esterase/lipase family protein [Bacteroidales bacterium]